MTTVHLSQRQYIALLAVFSAVILFAGVWLRPEKPAEVAPMSPAESSRLVALAQRSKLEDQAAYFSGIAAGIQRRVLWIEELAASGLVWNADGSIVTAGPPRPLAGTITGVGAPGQIPLDAELLSPSFPVAVVKASPGAGLEPVQRGSAARLVPGMWILQVARQPGGEPLFTPGVYSGVASVKCGVEEHRAVQSSIPLTAAALGAGLFDLDANLLAVVLRCGDRFAAFVPEEVDAALMAANSMEGRLLRLYGMRVVALDDRAREHFSAAEGVWVSETLEGMRADAAGLMPGDVILALDGEAVREPGNLTPILTPARDAVFVLQIRRERRNVRVELPGSLTTPETAAGVGVGPGIALTPAPEGHPIESVAPGSAAERAGVMPGDRLLLVDGAQLPNLAAARRAIARTGGEAVFLTIQRGGRKLGVFVP